MSTLKVGGIRGVSASSDAITVANDGTCTASITNNLSNRNKVINGGMIVNQRGDQSATGSEGYFACDRFKTVNGCGAQVAISQSTDTPDGFGNSMKWDCTTADTSIAASDFFIIRYSFEGQDLQDMQKGTSSAKKVVLSFYAKATKTGTYIVELIDHDNSSRHVNKSYTISDTNWNRYTISFPADTTGTIDNDNARSMDINFWLVAGSTYNSGTLQTAWGADTNANRAVGQVNAMDSTSNDFFLTGVQLEVDQTGSGVATDFEHRSFGQELTLCQRYYQQYVNPCITGVIPDNGSKAYSLGLQFQTRMRAVPTLTIANAGTGGNVSDGNSTQTIASLNAADRNVDGASIYLNLNGDLGDFRPACTGLNDSTTNTTTYKFTAEF